MTYSTPTQVTFGLNNPGANNTIYISSDPSDNQVTMTVTLSADATFTPATNLVPFLQAGSATGSLLYLDLTALGLDSTTLGTFSLTANGWQSQAFPDDNMIALTPTASVTAQALSFQLNKFVLPAYSGGATAQLALDIFHVPNVATGAFPAMYQTNVAVTYPSDAGQDLHDALTFAINPTTVLTNNPPGNDLKLVLSAKADGPTVPAGADTVFTLSVVYDATDPYGYGALMTPAQGSAISIPTPVGTQWKIKNVPGTAGRSWEMRPPAGQPLPGPNGNPVAFDFSPVVSTFQPGPTVVLLTYSKVPGYKDGAFAFTLLKQPKVTIDSFTVTPALSELTNGKANVTLNWTTSNVTSSGSLILNPGMRNVTGKTSLPDTITATTNYSLVAYGPGGMGANNWAIKNATATVVPVLNQLEAVPSAISVDDFAAGAVPLTLRWAINAGAGTTFQLDTSLGQGHTIASNLGPLAAYPMTVNEPQMFTLSITDDQNPLHQWKNYVPAFQLQSQSPPPGTAVTSPVAAPGASYVAACASGGQVSILSTAGYQSIASVATGGQPAGIAFSPDGSSFYVADKAGGSIVPVNVTASSGSTPPWSFQVGTSFSTGGAPSQLAYGAGNIVYAAVANGSNPGWLAAVDLKTQQVQKVQVGVGASAVAVSPSGAQIFVSNTTDGTVSQIGRAIDGTYQPIQTLTGLPGAAGIAITPNGMSLLVVCSDGTLRVMDATSPDTSRAKSIAIGGAPIALALDAAGAYAFVLDASNTRVVVVSLAKSAVIGTPPTIAAGATDISISPDGTIALIGGAQLSVLALQTYLGRSYSANCGGLVTDVVVTADGTSAFAWANASITHRQAPAQGLQVYNVAGQTITPQFTDRQIVSVTVPRLKDFTVGMVSILEESGLYPLDCAGPQLLNPIPVPAKVGMTRQPMSLASSNDGQTVFAVVSNGSNSYSLVVLTGGGGNAFSVAADVSLFTTLYRPLSVPVVAAPDGSAAYVYDSTNGNVWTVTGDGAGNFTLVATPLRAPGPLCLGFVISPDGGEAYLATQQSFNTTFYVIDTAAQSIETFPLSEPTSLISIQEMAMSPDGSRIFATDTANGCVRAIDTLSLRFQQTVTWPTSLSGPMGIAVSGDQANLFVATSNGQLASAPQVRPAPSQRILIPRFVSVATGDVANGVFIRHQMGDYPGNNGGSFSACPDIVISINPSDPNHSPQPLDPTTVISAQGYYTEFNPGSYIWQGNANYIYLRALNNASSLSPPPQVNPRLWLYYTASNLALWPTNWQSNNIQVQGQSGQQNWQDTTNLITNTITGQGGQSGQQLNLLATGQAFLWSPPVLGGGNHYCLIAMAENPLNNPPTPPLPGVFQTWNDLCNFVLTNDWFGWRNTQAVQASTPSWELLFTISGPPQTGLTQIGVQCANMPVGSTFSFSAAGPHGTTNPGDGVSSGTLTIKNPNQGSYVPMLFPSNFNTTLVVNWNANGTTPGNGAKITPYLAQTSSQMMPILAGRVPLRPAIQAWEVNSDRWVYVYPFGSMTVAFV
jgi:DNA-binding beta-propeller fold protein YncE